jgi:polyhydroxyalkanoate synthase
VLKVTGQKDLNAIGYCLGGTLLACTLAYMAAKKDRRIRAATFFASLVDFEDPGELGVFIDEEQLRSMDETMAEKGYLDGRAMATTFNMLRANDLIWSFVINNYLLGKEPFPFDLLYWNSDSTRMPYAMHSFYLRKFYQENKLVEPGGVTLLGTPIDLRKIDLPVYMLSTREDHIAPWKTTYSATQIYRGEVTFVLAGSGHIAGVINPPTAEKYGYWTGDALAADPERWLEQADKRPGSWWPHWRDWTAGQSGNKVKARKPGDGKLKVIEPAPGSYVKRRAV